ncbi:transposase [Proteus mirabilis]|nr:transposase [Proteus mirabilis]
MNCCSHKQIELCHIQSSKPQQNGFIERFNGSFCCKSLNINLCEPLS